MIGSISVMAGVAFNFRNSIAFLPTTTHTLSGTFGIPYTAGLSEEITNVQDKPCSSIPKYDRTNGRFGIDIGTQVTLKNSKLEIVGISSLQDGVLAFDKTLEEIDGIAIYRCKLRFQFNNISASSFYQIEIKDKVMNFSKEELNAQNWQINLTLD